MPPTSPSSDPTNPAHIHNQPNVVVEYLGNNLWSVVIQSITTTNKHVNINHTYLPSVCYTIYCQVEYIAPRFHLYLSHVTQAMADQRGNLGAPCSIPFTLSATNKALIMSQVIPAFAERWFAPDILPTPNRDNDPHAAAYLPVGPDPAEVQKDIEQMEALIRDADEYLTNGASDE